MSTSPNSGVQHQTEELTVIASRVAWQDLWHVEVVDRVQRSNVVMPT